MFLNCEVCVRLWAEYGGGITEDATIAVGVDQPTRAVQLKNIKLHNLEVHHVGVAKAPALPKLQPI